MNSMFLKSLTVMSLFSLQTSARDLSLHDVPSVVLNRFQQSFPAAKDIEWDMDGALFKAEFETGWMGTDHDVWYDRTGKLVRHKEEIAVTALPVKVKTALKNRYATYRIDDPEQITEGALVKYKFELKKWGEEWKVLMSAEGVVLEQIPD